MRESKFGHFGKQVPFLFLVFSLIWLVYTGKTLMLLANNIVPWRQKRETNG